jgi:hypothetical protein
MRLGISKTSTSRHRGSRFTRQTALPASATRSCSVACLEAKPACSLALFIGHEIWVSDACDTIMMMMMMMMMMMIKMMMMSNIIISAFGAWQLFPAKNCYYALHALGALVHIRSERKARPSNHRLFAPCFAALAIVSQMSRHN